MQLRLRKFEVAGILITLFRELCKSLPISFLERCEADTERRGHDLGECGSFRKSK